MAERSCCLHLSDQVPAAWELDVMDLFLAQNTIQKHHENETWKF